MLSVRLNGIPAGQLTAARNGELAFRYDDSWLAAGGYPLSACMPLSRSGFGEAVAGPWFDGLLPENREVRKNLAAYFQIEASDDFGMLGALGRECPGAVSLFPADAAVMPEDRFTPDYDVMDEARLARHIRELPARPLFVDADGELRLSLPGFHHKAAVLRIGEQLALPRARTPTSHILKIDIPGLPDSIRVENYCLTVAGRLGMAVPRSGIRTAEDQVYMLIARYDRVIGSSGDGRRYLKRLHQEDFCQALGRYPREKYEKDGGPGWKQCFDLMSITLDPAAGRGELLRRAVFQYLIGNPDAHAKNYALLYRANGTELANLYDVNNAAAFRHLYKQQRPRLAMFVGGERDPQALTPRHWHLFADEIGIRRDIVIGVLASMTTQLPDVCRSVRQAMRGTPADSALLDLVIEDVTRRCADGGWSRPSIRA